MSGHEESIVKWALGGLVTAAGLVATLFHVRINHVEDRCEKSVDKKLEKKVSKDVFEEFKKTNTQAHDFTHTTLEKIEEKQDKLFDLIGRKQDKKPGE